MKSILAMVLFVPLLALTQDKGIKFEIDLTWEQVKAKAKAERKYIFVDCYASWCGPCKAMDKNVYTDENVGKYMNERFVSVKIQMDTTKNDNKLIQQWYEAAHNISVEFDISSYPIFLFFDSESKIVHRDIGFKEPDDFIRLAKIASDPNKQYYSLLKAYKVGKKDFTSMPGVARKALELKQKETAFAIAQDYLKNYLYRQNKKLLYQKENLEFIRTFVQRSDEPGFKFFYKNSKKVDQVMGQKGYAQGVVDYIIANEEINPFLVEKNKNGGAEPDWAMIQQKIQQKYSTAYSDRNVLDAQLRWYEYKKDWPKIAEYQIKKIENYGLDTSGIANAFTNNMIWDVFFMHNNNLAQLQKAIGWMKIILKADPYDVDYIDTYANLLYKTGKVKEAIIFEKIAGKLDPNNTGLKKVLENMTKGEPTYLHDGAVWDDKTLPKNFKVSKSNAGK